MKYQVEVCIDNMESLHNAIAGGATRIELCSSLTLGGLTPSLGLMKTAAQYSSIPIYAMIRPRQGDFLYTQDDIETMLLDIDAAAAAGLQGVVFGVLNTGASVNLPLTKQLVKRAQQHHLGTTFHRAIDQSCDWQASLEALIELGFERILTSGLAANAAEGTEVLQQMVAAAAGRISIMAGAGINSDNVQNIVEQTGVTEVHLSGKTHRPSHMQRTIQTSKMGADSVDDFVIPITSRLAIEKVVKALKSETF